MPVEELDRKSVLCVVCLDAGCEWCPAVEAVEAARDEAPPDDAGSA